MTAAYRALPQILGIIPFIPAALEALEKGQRINAIVKADARAEDTYW